MDAPYAASFSEPAEKEKRSAFLAVADRAGRLKATPAQTLLVLDMLGLLDTAWEMRGMPGPPPEVPLPPLLPSEMAAADEAVLEAPLCRRGKHRMVPDNIAWKRRNGNRGYRECRACMREADRAHRQCGSAALERDSMLCAKGLHERTPENVRPHGSGQGMVCLPCRRESDAARRARKRAERLAERGAA